MLISDVVGHVAGFLLTICPIQELAAAGEQFDMVFIDADKDNYINYYNFILENNLLKLRGVLCVDNTLFKAKVYLKDATDGNGLALREFNQLVSSDPRVEQVKIQTFACCCESYGYPALIVHDVLSCLQVIIPLRDGMSVIRRVTVASECSRTQVLFT